MKYKLIEEYPYSPPIGTKVKIKKSDPERVKINGEWQDAEEITSWPNYWQLVPKKVKTKKLVNETSNISQEGS